MIIKHDEIGYTREELKEALAICGEDAECGVCPFREVCDEDETFIYRAALEMIEHLFEKFKSKSLLLSYMEVSLADALASVKDAVATMDEYEEQIAALEKENAMLKDALDPIVRKAVSIHIDGDAILDMIENEESE